MKWLVALVLLLGAFAALARDVDATIDRNDQKVMASKSFLDAHPDMKHRTEGWFAYREGRYAEARDHFLEAARFADKLSQAMLAEMHWNGQGTPVDRAIGYAWADLAAERGYVQFLALRERYWKALSPVERERAIAQGRALLLAYGDDVARPRMAEHLAHVTRRAPRPHKDATIVVADGAGGLVRVRGWDFYAEKFWDPVRYQAWVDARWAPLPAGTVDVRDLEVVREASDVPPAAREPGEG